MFNNKKIISARCMELANHGLISKDEGIFTKKVWRSKGYKVNKDETPITMIPIRIIVPRKAYPFEGARKRNLYIPMTVNAKFYSKSQVTEFKKGA